MYLQLIRFRLSSERALVYRARCMELAPLAGHEPGLLGMVWLADPDTGMHGLASVWTDGQALARFLQSDVFRAITAGAAATELVIEAFALMDAPSRVTLGALAPAGWAGERAPLPAIIEPSALWQSDGNHTGG